MHSKLAAASAAFAPIAGLVKSNTLPLPLACRLFESKVDSILTPTRWLWADVEGVVDILDNQYEE